MMNFLRNSVIVAGWCAVAGWVIALWPHPRLSQSQVAWMWTMAFLYVAGAGAVLFQILSDTVRLIQKAEMPESEPEPVPQEKYLTWGPWVNSRLAAGTELQHSIGKHVWKATFYAHDNIQRDGIRYFSAHGFALDHVRKIAVIMPSRSWGAGDPVPRANAWKTVYFIKDGHPALLDTLR